MGIYVIGIGGTGAKCIEAITQVAALGLFSEELIKVLFVDADETNGNLERARNTLSLYQRCYKLMSGDKQQLPWLKTPIESFDLWSPFGNRSTNKTLASFFNYNSLKQNNEALGNLFDILYTKEEQNADLDVGFRGRPAIGSAVMSRVDLDDLEQEPWSRLLGQIIRDVGSGKPAKILLCGSMFGGTGASGLPTIGRLIANKLNKENVREKVKIGCLFVLPYFGFSPKSGNNDKVYARADQFLLNTEAALRYYVDQAKQFDTVYLLGNQNFSQYEFSIGKKTQRNEPHFIELYAALAARHFWLNTPARSGAVVLISRQSRSKLLWNDLPDQDVIKPSLVNATRFAYVWLGDIVPELTKAKDIGVNRFQRVAPWFTRFFRSYQDAIIGLMAPKGESLPDFSDSREQDAIRIITDWCRDYLRWLNDIHQCDGDDIELFHYPAFAKLDGRLTTEELSKLVVGDDRDRTSQSQDTAQKLKERLDGKNLTPPNQGTAGLAKALYLVCRLNK